MKQAVLESRCECQATLRAVATQDGTIVSGSVRYKGKDELAPATRVGGTGASLVHVGWLCPRCGRNTLRSFDLGAIQFEQAS